MLRHEYSRFKVRSRENKYLVYTHVRRWKQISCWFKRLPWTSLFGKVTYFLSICSDAHDDHGIEEVQTVHVTRPLLPQPDQRRSKAASTTHWQSSRSIFIFVKPSLIVEPDHCIDVLRQGIMCRSDITLFTLQWSEDSLMPRANFGSVHECVDFDVIDKWAGEHRASNDTTLRLKHSKFGKLSCILFC